MPINEEVTEPKSFLNVDKIFLSQEQSMRQDYEARMVKKVIAIIQEIKALKANVDKYSKNLLDKEKHLELFRQEISAASNEEEVKALCIRYAI